MMGSCASKKRKASNEQIASCVPTKRKSPCGGQLADRQHILSYHEQTRFSTQNGCERYHVTGLENELLNAYLDMFLPQAFIRHNSLERIICDLSGMKEFTDPLSLCRIISTGSQVQGLSIPTYSRQYGNTCQFFGPDVDMCQLNLNTMEMLDGSSIPRYELRSLNDGAPNYVLLIQNGGWTEDANGEYVWCVDEEHLGKIVRNTQITQDFLLKNTATFQDRLGKLEDTAIHGPAFNFVSRDMNPLNTALSKTYFDEDHLKMNQGDVDFCVGIGFTCWPAVATNFLERYRPSGWPDGDLVATVVSHCHGVTPVGRNHSPTKDQEWRYSFSDAERILANQISNRQRTVFVLVKVLHAFFFKQPAIFKTYCLKTILFWLCERIPRSDWEKSKVQMVGMFLDEIIHVLAVGYLEDYFIKGANLLAGIIPSFRRTLAARVIWVKCHLFAAFRIVKSQIQFHSEIEFPVDTETLVEYFVNTAHSDLHSPVVHQVLHEAYAEFVLSVVIDLAKVISDQTTTNCCGILYWQSTAAINTALVILIEAFRKFYGLTCLTQGEVMSISGLIMCIESTLKKIKYVNASARAKVLCMLYYMNLNGNEQTMIAGLNYDSLLDVIATNSSESKSGSSEPKVSSSESKAARSEPKAGSSESKAGSFEPKAGSSQPKAGRYQPTEGSSEPTKNSSEPNAGSSKPKADSSKPKTDSSKPKADSSKPKAGNSKSKEGSSEPKTGHSQPKAGGSQHKSSSSKNVEPEHSSIDHLTFDPRYPRSSVSPCDWLKDNLRQQTLSIKKFKAVLSHMKMFEKDMLCFDNRYVLAQMWELVEKEYIKHNE